MATRIIYNDVAIEDCLTESIDQTVEYDSTNVDPLATRTTVTVHGTVHLNQGSGHGIDAANQSLAGLYAAVQSALLTPRRQFRMWIGNSLLMDVRPAAVEFGNKTTLVGVNLNHTDINHGPKPKLRVNKILGDQAMKVTFTVEMYVPNCDSSKRTPDGVVNLRYWIGDDIDCTDWRTTRTFRGRLRVSGKNVKLSHLRSMCIPPLENGFRRKNIALHESEDGLLLDFTVTDEEMWAVAPKPATHWDGNLSLSSPMAGGAVGEAELRVLLHGDRNTDKRDLMKLAAQIVDKKLHAIDQLVDGSAFLLYTALNESLSLNRVEMIARIKLIGGKQGDGFTLYNLPALQNLGKFVPIEGYTPNKSYAPGPTAGLQGWFTSLLQTPCLPQSFPAIANTDTIIMTTPTTPEKNPYKPESGVPPYKNSYSNEHLTAAYSNYALSSEMHEQSGSISLPVAYTNSAVQPASTVSAIQVARARAHREIRIEAERLHKWPEIPKPVSFKDENQITHTIRKHMIAPGGTSLSADGKKDLYSTHCRLVYDLSRPPTFSEGVRAGTLPYRVKGYTTDRLPGEFFIAPTDPRAIA